MLAGVAQGALAASVAASGNAFKVSGDRLEGSGFTVMPGTYTEPGGSRHQVLVVTAREAQLENLCVSLLLPELMGRRMTVVVKAGASRPVRATGLSVNADQASGNLRLTDVSAQALGASKGGGGPGGLLGNASRLVVHDPRFTGWQGAAGSFHLQDLTIRLKPGKRECF